MQSHPFEIDHATMIKIGGVEIPLAQQQQLELPVARLPTQTLLSLPVTVINGKAEGPILWLSAAIHGDEINGVEIIRQVLRRVSPAELTGTLIAVPIVNIYGFIEQSRYLPDRRDLNRSFPGSPRGSLASRLAHLFMEEVVRRSTHGIDLHTATDGRSNLPQIRANLRDPETYRCAQAFGAPIAIHSTMRDGSLRQAATQEGIPILLYEGGEALRFDRLAIEIGVEGILRVMENLGMYQLSDNLPLKGSIEIESTQWVRAPRSGILLLEIELGQRVRKKEVLGTIVDAFGNVNAKVYSPCHGMTIGLTKNPLVNQGNGIVHLAQLE